MWSLRLKKQDQEIKTKFLGVLHTHYTNFTTRPELGSKQIEVTTVCASLRTVAIIIRLNNSYLINETTLKFTIPI